MPLYIGCIPLCVNPETLEFAYCDAYYQYILLTHTDVLLLSLHYYILNDDMYLFFELLKFPSHQLKTLL